MVQLFVAVSLALYFSFIDGADRDAIIMAAVLVPLFIAVTVML